MAYSVVCGATQCPSNSTIQSPDYSDDAVYNATDYQCIWVFNCRSPSGTTVLDFLDFNRTTVNVDCDTNFVEIREGLHLLSFRDTASQLLGVFLLITWPARDVRNRFFLFRLGFCSVFKKSDWVWNEFYSVRFEKKTV